MSNVCICSVYICTYIEITIPIDAAMNNEPTR